VVRRFLILFFFLFGSSCFGWAQAPVAASQAGNTENVTLGQSAVPLYGPWKFTVGDSPLDPATHQPLWAEPGFDDSKWENVDLTPKEGATDPLNGISGYVSGWTAKGHPGYWGYAWYRIHVRVEDRPGQRLALAGPSDFDDAYQLFANGRLLGSYGDFASNPPGIYYSQPVLFSPPAADSPAKQGQTLVLAFRFFMEPNTLTGTVNSGGFHGAPVFGDQAAILANYQSEWIESFRISAYGFVEVVLCLAIGLGAFCLIFFDRSDRVYLWIGITFLTTAVVLAVNIVASFTTTLTIASTLVLNNGLFNPISALGWAMIWWLWFDLRRSAWIPRVALLLALLGAVSGVFGQDIWYTLIPHSVSTALYALLIAVRIGNTALQLWIVYKGIRLHGVEGWLVLFPALLSIFGRFFTEFQYVGLNLAWFPFGISVGISQIARLALIVVIVLLLLRRLVLSLRRQRQMALDVKQAQEVQQVILPLARMTLPGLEIESEYRPALEVGGDFFQIIPHPMDGSVLIVAGDVAGKGLRSGMLVALLVGAIRSTVHFSFDPKIVLGELNERLLGRGDAQATCLALRIEASGAATLVNAGHLPPYLNDEPLAMEGALPLGMLPGAHFSSMNFKLAEDDRLLLLSDGIAEARDADGQLFGFERVAQLLQSHPSAAELAVAAERFGQQDDISVIAVTRTPVREAAVA
jgi:hypothetical protein